MPISCLTTSPSHFSLVEQQLLKHQFTIEAWLSKEWEKIPVPFYASVDLRNAGFKLAPVDTNLFPSGFNNLNPDFFPLMIQATQATFKKLAPKCQRILLVPENHTRNLFYLESLAVLQDILFKSGFEVRIASLSEKIKSLLKIALPSGRSITLEKIQNDIDHVYLNDFFPCCILLNNDLSNSIPEILNKSKQLILPSLNLGWSKRLKSQHFHYYAEVCNEVSELIGLDPWLINPLFQQCEAVNFLKRKGEECLVHYATVLLESIRKKYKEYNIKEVPYVVIKADAGTYGIGVLSIDDPEKIRYLNRKKRTAMSVTKGNKPITQVILQEGIHTVETWQNAVAEPVIYTIGQYVIGGFYRVHKKKSISDNLNAPGMHFVPLTFIKNHNITSHSDELIKQGVNRFYIYSVITRLALIAAAREQVNLQMNKKT